MMTNIYIFFYNFVILLYTFNKHLREIASLPFSNEETRLGLTNGSVFRISIRTRIEAVCSHSIHCMLYMWKRASVPRERLQNEKTHWKEVA